MSEAGGGAASEAICAGERIWRAASQPAIARTATADMAPRTIHRFRDGLSRWLRTRWIKARGVGARKARMAHDCNFSRACVKFGQRVDGRTSRGGPPMTRHGFRRPSPAMVVSLAALVVAMGGTSYAVVKPSPHSVGSKQLKTNAVTSADVKNESLTAQDINEATLAQVPLAARAATADLVARAGGVDRVFYRVSTVGVGQASGDPANPATLQSTLGVATARC